MVPWATFAPDGTLGVTSSSLYGSCLFTGVTLVSLNEIIISLFLDTVFYLDGQLYVTQYWILAPLMAKPPEPWAQMYLDPFKRSIDEP